MPAAPPNSPASGTRAPGPRPVLPAVSPGALGAAGLRVLRERTPVFVLAPFVRGPDAKRTGLVGIRASHFRPCHFFSGFGDLRKRDEHLSVVFT